MSAKLFNKSMLILLAATFFYMTSLMMLGPIMAGYCGSLGGSAVVMGLVAGMSNFAALLCRPFVGPAVDRCDRRMIGLLGMASMLAGAAASALASNVWILMFGRLFTGAGFAISSGTLSTWVASSLPHENIGQGMGLYGMVQALSQAIAPAFGLALAQRLSYRTSCVVSALCAVIGILLILPMRDAHYAAMREAGQGAQKRARRKGKFILPELIPVALIVLLFCIPYNGTSSFLATVASDRALSFSVGSFFTIYAVFLLVVRFFLSKALDQIPFRKFILIAVPFGVVSMFCLHWMHSFGMMILSAFLLTFAYGMVQPICQAAGIRSVPIDEHGVANCTYYIGLDLGLAFGPTLSGALYGAFGEQGLFLALAVVPALSIVVLAASKRVLDRLGL